MERDATLEDFRTGSESDPSGDGSDESTDGASDRPGETAGTGETPDTDGTDETFDGDERATSTMSYRPGGGACTSCGTVVERRWRGADGLVCRDCKDW